jgi:polyphosphate kinase
MERNFFRRIELCFPVLEPKLKRRILKEGLMPYLADNSQAWEMDGKGDYRRKRSRKKGFSAQEALLAEMLAAPAKD